MLDQFRLSWTCELNVNSEFSPTHFPTPLSCFNFKLFLLPSFYYPYFSQESAAPDTAEKGSNGWTQFEERGIQVLRRNISERRLQLQDNMEMPCFPPTTMAALATSHRTLNTQLLIPQSYNRESLNYYDAENADPRTLDLFPHKSDDQDGICLAERKSMFCASASMDTDITSTQFFEFLPLRN